MKPYVFYLYITLCLTLFSLPVTLASTQGDTQNLTCIGDAGLVTRDSFHADSIQTTIFYTVYMPPCYDANEDPYPVLYLMHGSNEDDGQWERLGLYDLLDARIAAGDIPPVIAVMPFGEWIANENRFGGASWDAVFMDQLLPTVEAAYRIDADRRALGGISRGGFWAYQIGLRFPAMFDAIGGHSAFFDRFHAPPEYNPLDLAQTAPGIDSLRLWLDRGADDFAAPGLDLMSERLTERGIEHTYTMYPEGQHNNDYWRVHLPEYLDFYVGAWETLEPAAPSMWATATPRAASTPRAPQSQATDAPPTDTQNGVDLFVPVVAFPSRLTTLTAGDLQAIRAGNSDSRLIVDVSTVEALAAHGVTLSADTRVVDDIERTLWSDRTRFTLVAFDALTPRLRVLDVDEVHPLDTDLSAYPFAFDSDLPNYQPDKLTRIAFSGVTALARRTIPALDENSIEWAASGIMDYASRPDYFHMSTEVSFVEGCPTPSGETVLGGSSAMCAKRDHYELFNLLDADIIELTGNHNNDYGYDPYFESLAWFRENGFLTVGGGADESDAQTPLIIQQNGHSIALVACNWAGPYYALANDDPDLLGGVRPGAADCAGAWLRDLLPQLDAAHDVVIVTVQYVETDAYTPTEQARFDFRALADLGADAVLGTSAHFPQTFEFYNSEQGEAFIHYGMGNLYFDQTFFAGVRFFMDQLFIYDGRLLTVDLFTGIIQDQGRPRPMTPDERENFLFLMFTEYGGM